MINHKNIKKGNWIDFIVLKTTFRQLDSSNYYSQLRNCKLDNQELTIKTQNETCADLITHIS